MYRVEKKMRAYELMNVMKMVTQQRFREGNTGKDHEDRMVIIAVSSRDFQGLRKNEEVEDTEIGKKERTHSVQVE